MYLPSIRPCLYVGAVLDARCPPRDGTGPDDHRRWVGQAGRGSHCWGPSRALQIGVGHGSAFDRLNRSKKSYEPGETWGGDSLDLSSVCAPRLSYREGHTIHANTGSRTWAINCLPRAGGLWRYELVYLERILLRRMASAPTRLKHRALSSDVSQPKVASLSQLSPKTWVSDVFECMDSQSHVGLGIGRHPKRWAWVCRGVA